MSIVNLKQNIMKHPFLTDQEISQIIEKLEKKKKMNEDNLKPLMEIAKTSGEREKISSDDGGLFESLLLEKEIAKDSLSRAKETIERCEETLLQIRNCPKDFGFDKRTSLPLPIEVLLCNPLCRELPPEYYNRKQTQKI